MQLEILKKTISDPVTLARGYCFHDGYIFTAIRHPANVFDAILIRNPSSAYRFGDEKALSSHSLNEHIEYINKYKIDKAIVIADDISFLEQCPTLKHLNVIPSVTAGDDFDFSPLYNISEIQSLRCSTKYGKFNENNSKIDYSLVHGLVDLCVRTEYDINFQCVSTLKRLSVFEYKSSEPSELFSSKELDTLEVVSNSIRTLNGIENSPKMQCLYLTNNRQLQDIRKLAEVKDTLKALRIENCPKITDFSVLKELKALELLELSGSNSIKNLDFIKELPNLKTFIFNINVENGDLSPCMNLSYVYSERNRKHYNIKDSELPKNEYVHGNENIELWRRLE